MNHRFNELSNIEHTLTRAVNAACTFADSVEKRELHKALEIIAVVRHTAMYLCDNPSSEEEMVIIERIINFIKD